MDSDRRDHVAINFDRLAEMLGMTGTVLRAWVEPGDEWVHVLTIPEVDDPNGLITAKGGYCEIRMPNTNRYQKETVDGSVRTSD